jgi:hypothetical protein
MDTTSHINVEDRTQANMLGKVKLFRFPADSFSEETVYASLSWVVPVLEQSNLVVGSAELVVSKLLQREFADYMPAFIVLGSGGDLEQEALIDSGARVAPAADDQAIRQVVAKLPIIQVIPDESVENTWSYVAIARPTEALTASLNELGIETQNGTLISHFVTNPVGDEVRSHKYAKSSLEYLVIQWSLTFNLSS